nr:hypothetical protein BaRGS_022037 [Batillaria attramentaria]
MSRSAVNFKVDLEQTHTDPKGQEKTPLGSGQGARKSLKGHRSLDEEQKVLENNWRALHERIKQQRHISQLSRRGTISVTVNVDNVNTTTALPISGMPQNEVRGLPLNLGGALNADWHLARVPSSYAAMEAEEQSLEQDIVNYVLRRISLGKRATAEPSVDVFISKLVRTILSLPPDERTEKDMQTALLDLQCIPGFSIATEPQEEDSDTFKEMTTRRVLTQGMCFGDATILEETRRRVTVTSHRDMQLLAVSRDDYMKLFQFSLIEDLVPDYISFIFKMRWMRNWPTHQLIEHRQNCFYRFYRKGRVVVADSRESDYLYVVRSGTCNVMMYIEETEASWRDLKLCLAHPTINMDDWPGTRTDSRLPHYPRRNYAVFARQSASRLELGNMKTEPSLHMYSDVKLRCAPLKESGRNTANHGKRERSSWNRKNICSPHRGSQSMTSLGTVLSSDEDDNDKDDAEDKDAKDKDAEEKDAEDKGAEEKGAEESPGGTSTEASATGKSSCTSQEKDSWSYLSAWERRQKYKVPSGCMPPRQEYVPSYKRTYSVKKPPVYVVLEELQAGAVFGFDQMRLPLMSEKKLNSPKTSLVSGTYGAEVVGISKRFFMLHANDRVQRDVEREVPRYPEPEAVRSRYRLQLAGELYMEKMKQELYDDASKAKKNFGVYFDAGKLIDPKADIGMIPDVR